MTAATTVALRDRIGELPAATHSLVFDPRQIAILAAIAARLIPQSGRTAAIDLPGTFRRRVEAGTGLGWRHAGLPPTIPFHQRGLDAVDASAVAIFGSPFAALPAARRDELLRAIQAGRNEEATWHGIDPALWFTETLAALADIFYSHPLAQDEIGYAGMADAHGWSEVGLDAREAHEPAPLSSVQPAS